MTTSEHACPTPSPAPTCPSPGPTDLSCSTASTWSSAPCAPASSAPTAAASPTLLRLVAGRLAPQRGSVHHTGELGYLPQTLTLGTSLAVDEALGVDRVRRAIERIELGIDVEANLELVGDDWDAQDRACAVLDRLGLGSVGLDRRVGELSGGETVSLGLAAVLLRRPDVLLLDEPTNNLDRRARRRLYEVVEAFTGALLVVSHDRELLDRMDQIGDLRDGDVTWYGGGVLPLSGGSGRRPGGGRADGSRRRVRRTPAAA